MSQVDQVRPDRVCVVLIFEARCRFNVIIHPIKPIRSIRIPKPILRQRCAVYHAIVTVAAFIVGIAAEGPVAHEALLEVGGEGGAVGRNSWALSGVEVLDFLFAEGAVVYGDVVEEALKPSIL